jgi:hypothetical protein
VTSSRKGAKSRTGGRKLRSTGTKGRAHVCNRPNSLVELKKQLEVRTELVVDVDGLALQCAIGSTSAVGAAKNSAASV